jgi:hypothetical protein
VRAPHRKDRHLSLRALLASFALAATPAAQLGETAVRAGYEESLAAVAAVLEQRLEPPPPLRFVEPHELGARAAEENLELFLRQHGERAAAELAADQAGAQFAEFAFAKYSWSSKEFLVVLPTWNTKARLMDRIELVEDECVRAVLVHELVHALDDRTHDLGKSLLACADSDQVQGFNAVLEGHAQHLTRRVCAARGWSDGFATYTELIGALPPGLDEATLQIVRVQAATLNTAYAEGERFMAALLERGGEEAVARAFRAPPDAQTVFHPEWFLDPRSKPEPAFDPGPAFALFLKKFEAQDWTPTRMTLTPAQFAAALALLPPETVAPLLATLRAARITALQPAADPGSKQVALGVLEFADEAAAKAYVAAARELSRTKDERMRTGTTRILSTTYDELGPGLAGFHARKRVRSGLQELDVTMVELQDGPLVLETSFNNEPIEREAHVELVRGALAALKAR